MIASDRLGAELTLRLRIGELRDDLSIPIWRATSFESLSAEHFERVAALGPELVVFGSGARLRFPRPAVLRPLIEARIGVETMDSAAACRTYNVLLAEGRRVVAALLFAAHDTAAR